MYSLKNNSELKIITIRGYNLTKKLNKKQSRGSLVFLRPPKHFNIGKRKIHSFRNYQKFFYYIKLSLPTSFILKNPYRVFYILKEIHKFHLLYNISSIKISLKTKIFFSDNSYSIKCNN